MTVADNGISVRTRETKTMSSHETRLTLWSRREHRLNNI
jgi:hypothetical protein